MVKKKVEIRLSDKAITDLSEIADYTLKTWGRKQSREYRDDLNNIFQTIKNDPLIGRKEDIINSGLRSIPSRSHRIYYIENHDYILIVRILNQRMDETSKLF